MYISNSAAIKGIDTEGTFLASVGGFTTIKPRSRKESSLRWSLLVNESLFFPCIESDKTGFGNVRKYPNELGQGRAIFKGSSSGKQKQGGFEDWKGSIVSNVSISTHHPIPQNASCYIKAFPHLALVPVDSEVFKITPMRISQIGALCLRKESEFRPQIPSYHNTRSSISLADPRFLEKDIAMLLPFHSNTLVEIQEGKESVDLRGAGARLKLIVRVMKGFWRSCRHTFKSMVVEHETSPAANDTPPRSDISRQGSTTTQGTKRLAISSGNDDLDGGDDGDQRVPKRSKIGLDPENLGQRFACPYRKHDPRKYCIQDWRICALTHHKTVARVKAHLYRYHLIHQCERCKALFDTEDELDSHRVAFEPCTLRTEDPVEGITRKMKQSIQSRKKEHPNQTEAEKWQQIYRILFPGELAPDPYFEPVVDQGDNIPQNGNGNADRVSTMEEFLRREVPQLFKKLLQETMQFQSESYEGGSGSQQLLDLLVKAQNQAFKNYRETTSNASSVSSRETAYSMDQEFAFHLPAVPAIIQQTQSPADPVGISRSVQWRSDQKMGTTNSTSPHSTVRGHPIRTSSKDASKAITPHPNVLTAIPQISTTPHLSSALEITRRNIASIEEIGGSNEASTARTAHETRRERLEDRLRSSVLVLPSDNIDFLGLALHKSHQDHIVTADCGLESFHESLPMDGDGDGDGQSLGS